jgi:nucleoid-associated protein YgaU
MKKLTLFAALFALLLGSVAAEAASNRMTYEQFSTELAMWQQREADANAGSAALDIEIAALRAEIEAMRGRIDSTWNAIYAELGTDAAGAAAYAADLQQLRDEIQALNNLTPEQLVERLAEIEALQARLAAAQESPLARLSANAAELAELERLLGGIMQRMERAASTWYSVVRGDCLWNIAGKERVYRDPFQWTRLYSANRDQIQNPDLIFPDQRLAVPRMTPSGQYLVMRGDSFVSISEKVYGDATKWRRIQEANSSLLDQLGGLYPGMVLVLP